MRRVWTITAVCLTFLFLFCFPSIARAEEVTMEAEVGYEGTYLLEHWTPIRVRLKNTGKDMEGSLEVRIKTGQESSLIYSTPVSLPNTSEKEYTIYAKMPMVERNLNIDLISGKQKKTLKVDTLNPIGGDSYLLGLVTDDQPSLGYWKEKLAGNQLLSKYEPISLDASNFPDRGETLAPFSVLILNNMDTTALRPEQIDTLDAWLEDGGLLIIGTGLNGRRTLSGLSERLFPAASGQLKQWGYPDMLEELGGTPILSSEPLQVMDLAVLDDGQTGEHGLVWTLRKDRGMIYFAGFDLGTEPIISWTGNKLFWEKLLSQTLDSSAQSKLYNPYEKTAGTHHFQDVLGNIEAMEMPSIVLILFLFLFYLVLAGPFNYMFLKKIDKREWSWFTIPTLSILFAALIFGLGYNTKGGELITNTLSVVNMNANTQQADLTEHVGIFIPRRGDYEVEVDRFALFSLGTENTYGNPGIAAEAQGKIVQGNPSRILYENANIWTMKTFETDSRPINIGFIQSDLSYEMGKVTGTIRNETAYPLDHLVIYTTNAFVEIGKIAAGESKSVELVLPLIYQDRYNNVNSIIDHVFPWPSGMMRESKESRQTMTRRGILEKMLGETYDSSMPSSIKPGAYPNGTGGAQSLSVSYFAFYEAEPEANIRINGRMPDRSLGESILIGSLDMVVEKDGMINIPPGVLSGRLERDMSRDAEDGGDMVYIYDQQGYAVFSVDLTSFMHLEDLKVMIGMGTMYGEGTYQIFDLEQLDYVDLQDDRIAIDESNIGKYVDVDNMIYIKALPRSGHLEMGLPVVTLEGREP